MKPGRELDALIAEKVMGKKLPISVGWWTCDKLPEGSIEICPFYSTDIAAAWQVVEKIQTTPIKALEFYEFQIHETPIWDEEAKKHTKMGWEVGWGWYGCDSDFGFCISAKAQALPEAICLAALKAVEG
jgi:hypothetical protein